MFTSKYRNKAMIAARRQVIRVKIQREKNFRKG